jgi:hypothetical protein
MHDHDVLLGLAILTHTTGDPDMIGWLTGLAGVVAWIGCALTFASEAKFEIEAQILFHLEAKKKPDFT